MLNITSKWLIKVFIQKITIHNVFLCHQHYQDPTKMLADSVLPPSKSQVERIRVDSISWTHRSCHVLLSHIIVASYISRSIRSLEPVDLSRSFCILLYHSIESLSGTMGEKTQTTSIEWFLWENNSIPCCKLCILVSSAALHSWGESPLGKTTVTWVSKHPNID